jgi:hypothetical protein
VPSQSLTSFAGRPCLVAVDAAFKAAFGTLYKPERESWAWPSLDPGKWAPSSLLIIYHEDGVHDEWAYPVLEPKWRRFEKELEKRVFGFPVFIESINAAVSAIYKAG